MELVRQILIGIAHTVLPQKGTFERDVDNVSRVTNVISVFIDAVGE